MYIPNWSDPRTQRRLVKALKFACFCLSPIKEKPVSKKVLDEHLGQQQNPLSAYLRKQLLVCTDDSYMYVLRSEDSFKRVHAGSRTIYEEPTEDSMGPLTPDVKKYIRAPGYADLLLKVDLDLVVKELAENGVQKKLLQIFGCAKKDVAEKLRSDFLKAKQKEALESNLEKMLMGEHKVSEDTCNTLKLVVFFVVSGGSPLSSLEVALGLSHMTDKYGPQIESGEFTYKDSSHRLWHGAQQTATDCKNGYWTFFGYPYNYDISSCAPNVLYQLARQNGLKSKTPMYDEYLADHRKFREDLAQSLGLTDKEGRQKVKQAMTSMFNGAQLRDTAYWDAKAGREIESAMLKILGAEKVRAVKNNAKILALKKDIDKVWKVLKATQFTDLPQTQCKHKSGTTYWRTKALTGSQKWKLYFMHERRVLEVARAYCSEHSLRVFCEHDGWRTDGKINVMELEQRILDETGFKLKIKEEHSELSDLQPQ